MRYALAIVTAGLLCAGAQAQIVMNGTAEAGAGGYGAALAVQNVGTQFGDSSLGVVDFANGSELDGVFARIRGGRLYITYAGNLESNFNKLEIFIDSIDAAGQNTILPTNPDVDFGALQRMAADPNDPNLGPGLTFDAGFAPDFWVGVTCGNSPLQVYCNWAELKTDGSGIARYLGGREGAIGNGGELDPNFGGSNPDCIYVSLDNSNTLGVLGGTGADSGAGVSTGVEVSIPLKKIGSNGTIKVFGFINGSGHDFCSNQALPGLGAGTDNLGEIRMVNFSDPAGDRWVTVSQVCDCDVDADGDCDQDDLDVVLFSFGASGLCPNTGGDLDGDGDIDQDDLDIELFGFGCSGG